MTEMRVGGDAPKHVRTLLSEVLPARLPLSLLIPAALVLWFSVPTLVSLNAIWLTDADYAHGHLALILAVWLAIRESRAMSELPVTSRAGAACLLLIAPFVIIGHASSTVLIAQLALPALWIAAVWALAGAPFARRLALPLSYFYFAIPMWNFLIEPMRRLTILVVTICTRAAGLPAFIEGNLVHVPSGTFEVEGGCAGLRYALIAAALAAFRGILERRRWREFALLMVSAIALALVGNWVRVFTTVAAGLTPESWLLQWVRDYHTLFGWILFVVFMVPLFVFDRGPQAENDVAVAAPSPVVVRKGRASAAAVSWILCAVLAAGIWIGERIDGARPLPDAVTLFSLPEVTGWQAATEWRDDSTPVFVGASAWAAEWYTDGTTRIGAYVAHYPSQRQGHEVVFALNRPAGQSAVVAARPAVPVAAESVAFEELEVLTFGSERRLVWIGRRVAGKPAAGELFAKVLQLEGAIRGRRDAQALVLTASCGSECGDARSSLSRFAQAAASSFYEAAEQSLGKH